MIQMHTVKVMSGVSLIAKYRTILALKSNTKEKDNQANDNSLDNCWFRFNDEVRAAMIRQTTYQFLRN